MAKSISTPVKPIGVFFAAEQQETHQAPSPTAHVVTEQGVLSGFAYYVYVRITLHNVIWMRLESATAGFPEWARESDSVQPDRVYGEFVAL